MALSYEDQSLIQWVGREYVHCHSKWCQKCTEHAGAHGPYWRGFYRVGSKLKSVYIGRELPDELRYLVRGASPSIPADVPKSKPRPAAARYTPPADERPAYLLGEAEAMLGLRPGYSRERVRKKLWNMLALKSCTPQRANELIACANVILKWHGWTPFGQTCRGKQETQSQAH